MNFISRITITGLSFIFFSTFVYSQDSASYNWTVSSKKTGDGQYELIFSTNGVKGWQLYSPSQPISDITTVELKFGDSAISQKNGFTEKGISREIRSPLSENAKVKVYDQATEWKKMITISGTVPAQL